MLRLLKPDYEGLDDLGALLEKSQSEGQLVVAK